MIKKQRLYQLTKFYGEERKFLGDGFYRLKKLSEERVELEFSVTDPCGASIPHPKILVSIQEDQLVPLQLIDMFQTPVEFIKKSDEAQLEKLHMGLENLMKKFEENLPKG